MAALRNTSIALRGSQGIWFVDGPPQCTPSKDFQSRTCKVISFSEDGSLFAFCDGVSVNVMTTDDFRLVLQIDRPRTHDLVFSPKNTYIATWEQYAVNKDNPQGATNLNIWEIKTGRLMRGLSQKKFAEWAPQWSWDEDICGRNVNNEVQFYEKDNFDSAVQKLHLQKVLMMKLTPWTVGVHHVAAYVPGSKGQPSYVRVYRYPNFGGPNSALANKSFYQADKVDMLWNHKGTGLLLLTASDTSADSYYGDQGLHYVGTDGESCLVPRQKNGPVYSVEWSPNSTEFTVVYGFMPAKATLYNLKCDPIFDFGTGPRNTVYYNPQGNVLCLAGFGNLGGNMEFWDPKSKRLIGKAEARDTTFFEWCPDGKHIVTATTSPRLRVGNGFKFWDFTGQEIYGEQVQANEELYNVTWIPALPGVYPPPTLPSGGAAVKVEAAVKPAAYVPPGLRNRPTGSASTTKYRENYEPPSNQKSQVTELSKSALKNKKRREAKLKPKTEVDEEPFVPHVPAAYAQQPPAAKSLAAQPAAKSAAVKSPAAQPAAQPADLEKEKKIKNIKKKLGQIQSLKEQQAAGKQLEKNQVEKLTTEASLRKELEMLKL